MSNYTHRPAALLVPSAEHDARPYKHVPTRARGMALLCRCMLLLPLCAKLPQHHYRLPGCLRRPTPNLKVRRCWLLCTVTESFAATPVMMVSRLEESRTSRPVVH